MLPTDMPINILNILIILFNIHAKLTRIFTSFFSHFFGDFWGAAVQSEYPLARLELCHEFSSYLIVFSLYLYFFFFPSLSHIVFFFSVERPFWRYVTFSHLFVAAIGKQLRSETKSCSFNNKTLRLRARQVCFLRCIAKLVGIIITIITGTTEVKNVGDLAYSCETCPRDSGLAFLCPFFLATHFLFCDYYVEIAVIVLSVTILSRCIGSAKFFVSFHLQTVWFLFFCVMPM